MGFKRDHAEHNEQLCIELLANKRYNDWVITTAFYSALHFVQSKIFPCVINGNNYAEFNTYYNSLPSPRDNKHLETLKIVSKYLPKVRKNYRSLYDACMNARYHNYTIKDAKAHIAKSNLEAIKSEC